MIGADSFYKIGSSHRVCQDYVDHVVDGEDTVVVLSDGCSTAPQSDWGARMLVRTAMLGMNALMTVKELAERAASHARQLELTTECLCATLLQIRPYPDHFTTNIIGDGVAVARLRKGGFVVVVPTFPSGAPMYPRYLLDGLDAAGDTAFGRYVKEYGGQRKLTEYVWDSLDTKLSVFTHKSTIVEPKTAVITSRFYRCDFDLVAIFSDGIHSFSRPVISDTSRGSEPVPLEEVLAEFMNFKTYKGDFVARRCQAAFKKFKEKGWDHYDDFSMAVIHAPEVPE